MDDEGLGVGAFQWMMLRMTPLMWLMKMKKMFDYRTSHYQ